MNEITFFISGKPYGQKRPRAVSRGGFITMYSPKENTEYAQHVVNAYFKACRDTGIKKTIEHTTYGKNALEVTIWASFLKPKLTKKREALNLLEDNVVTKKPDTDNIAKSVLDALNKIAYDDDSQVVSLHVYKLYEEVEGVKVTITPIMEV